MKYEKWLEDWLDNYVRTSSKNSTWIKYKIHCNSHINPFLGRLNVDSIDSKQIGDFCMHLLDKGLAPNTVNGILSTVKSSLCKASDIGISKTKDMHSIIRSKVREKQIECFSRGEQKIIEEYVLNARKTKLCGIIISLYSGLRIGELLALKWSDIDFERGMISVTKSCRDSWKDGKYVKVIDTVKTAHSMRRVPLPMQITKYLKKIKRSCLGEYVVDGKSTYGAQVRVYQKTFERVLNKLSLSHRGFHSLRHTFATRALEIGMDVKTLSEILGHSNPTVTLNRYAHSMLEYKVEMMNKLGKQLFIKKTDN